MVQPQEQGLPVIGVRHPPGVRQLACDRLRASQHLGDLLRQLEAHDDEYTKRDAGPPIAVDDLRARIDAAIDRVDMLMNQIRRFAAEVLPRLQAHEVKTVPLAEAA